MAISMLQTLPLRFGSDAVRTGSAAPRVGVLGRIVLVTIAFPGRRPDNGVPAGPLSVCFGIRSRGRRRSRAAIGRFVAGRARRAGLLARLFLAAPLASLALPGYSASASVDQGAVHFLRSADSAFDRYTKSKDRSYGAFLRRHIWRMIVYSPYFNNKTRWYPNGWVYDDAYAIYRGSRIAARHPEWILRDSQGRPLYIPFACSHGTCTQYAGDISNPAFRRHWIAEARSYLRHGYRGLYVDDVNMEFRVGNGQEEQVAPIDPATRRPMTYQAWRSYMARFMEQIRAALPHEEIVHNVIWFADSPALAADPYIRREIKAANYINLERGVNDSGLTGGSGRYSLARFLSYIDVVHALGEGVILQGNATDRRGSEYSLASYFLISAGKDAVSTGGMTPVHWWSAFDLNLGKALGPRRKWSGVMRRDFTGGMSLVNEPEGRPRTVKLPTTMRDLDGRNVKSVTLAPASGVVLRRP
jgi:hypothetical protein